MSDSTSPVPLIRLEVSGLSANDPALIAFRDFLQKEFGGEAHLKVKQKDQSTEPPDKGLPEIFDALKDTKTVMECILFYKAVISEDKLGLMPIYNSLVAHLKTLAKKGEGLMLYLAGKPVSCPLDQNAAQLKDLLKKERPKG